MKNFFKKISTLFLILSVFSSAYAFYNYPTVEVIDVTPGGANRDVVNALNKIDQTLQNNSNKIQQQQIQNRMDSLDQSCVIKATNYFNSQNSQISDIDKELLDISNKISSDPVTRTMQMSRINYLNTIKSMDVKQLNDYIFKTCSVSTAQGTKTNDQICEEGRGPNTKWTGEKASNGNLICGCKDGYVATKDNKCISATQSCQNSYGSFSIWSGKYNSDNGLECDCANGYIWNSNSSACTFKPQPQTNGGGGGGSVISVKNSCVKYVMGQSTDFGPLNDADCNIVWQKAVKQKQQESGIYASINSNVQVKKETTNQIKSEIPAVSKFSEEESTSTTNTISKLSDIEKLPEATSTKKVNIINKTLSWIVGLFGYRLEQ